MFGAPKMQPPPPPPEPANPPTFASQQMTGPRSTMPRFGSFDNTVLTGPMGAPDQRRTQRKSLLGQ